MQVSPIVIAIALAVRQRGGRALVVGGAVRDALLGEASSDCDLEVYGLSLDELLSALTAFGRLDLVGSDFGVIKLTDVEGATHDVAIPRAERKTGAGHRGFSVACDPHLPPAQAALRRDFTINAMSWDPLTEELLDFHGGVVDLRARVLRQVSSQFGEDPLRILRGLQFAGRFGLTLHPATATSCAALVGDLPTLPIERVTEEWMKWATRVQHADTFVPYLRASGLLLAYPEIAALEGVPQEPEWHPEGDVLTHTGHVLSAAVAVADRDGVVGEARAVLMFAALTHDFGKAATTTRALKHGRWCTVSPGHERLSSELASEFLQRLGVKQSLRVRVARLVANHLGHLQANSARALRRLAIRLQPASVQELLRLIEADTSGRPPRPTGIPPSAVRLREWAEQAGVINAPPPALLQGRHLLAHGWKPSPRFGVVLREAYEAQLEGAFTVETAQAWLANRLERLAQR